MTLDEITRKVNINEEERDRRTELQDSPMLRFEQKKNKKRVITEAGKIVCEVGKTVYEVGKKCF